MTNPHLVGSVVFLAAFLAHALWAGHPSASATPVAAKDARANRAPAGYPYARAACEYGARGGPYCANPRDSGDMYNWGYWSGRKFNASDRWGYEYRNCTSYVAWRLARSGVPADLFADLGDASQWARGVAGERGVVVNHRPSPGAIATWGGAGVGHVAWVVSVRGGRVTVADYNYDGTGSYARHVIPTRPNAYIHFPGRLTCRACSLERFVLAVLG